MSESPVVRIPTALQRQASAAKSPAATTEMSSTGRAPRTPASIAETTAASARSVNHPMEKARKG